MTNPMTTTADIIYSSSGSTPARLGIGSTNDVLTVAGGVPTWAAPGGKESADIQNELEKAEKAQAEAQATAKAALLEKLGISSEEASLLLS
jgi:hypothetical protein